ncbi:type VI secretion system contractile sheath domain-containing protein [Reinekea sp.]|jgi:type VI secretion system protein ImpC|uniref:type VI secretion system contractile sheath domain-containing protein n=1 Tax=Reinekea sp. TaxID=1970455 RepID=UPI002A82BF1D|nr:type VI secretion system contractile sheath large subunit [Reinekea sp.]
MALTPLFKTANAPTGMAAVRSLVVGQFGRRPWQKMDIDTTNFDLVLERMAPNLDLHLANGDRVELQFNRLADFQPSQLVECSAYFIALRAAMQILRQRASGAPESGDFALLQAWVNWQESDQPDSQRLWLRYNELRALLEQAVAGVLAHPDYQVLERNWTLAHQLVSNLKADQVQADQSEPHYRLTLLNLTKAHLVEDQSSVSNPAESQFYALVYGDELGQFGGVPYHLVSVQFELTDRAADLELMRTLAVTASAAQCVMSLAIAPSLYQDATLADEPLSQPRFFAWRALMESTLSRYLMLTAGQYAYRAAHRFQNLASGIGFAEPLPAAHWAHLHIWHIYEFALSHLQVGTALASAQPCDLRPLQLRTWPDDAGRRDDERLTPERQHILADLGINSCLTNEQRMAFAPRFQMRAGLVSLGPEYSHAQQDLHSELLLLQNQFARHLKVLIREGLGHGSPEEIKQMAQQWLQPFVQSPGLVSRSQWLRQPLESAHLSWQNDERGGQLLNIELSARLPDYDKAVELVLQWN